MEVLIDRKACQQIRSIDIHSTKSEMGGILLGSVTGASCDDAYVYIYSIEKEFDYFASNNKKDLEPILNHKKDAIIERMRFLVETFELSDNGQIKENIFYRIDNLAKRRWPEFIFSAADITI